MFQLQRFFLLHCDEWDRVVALPRHKFVTGATLLQLGYYYIRKTGLQKFLEFGGESRGNKAGLYCTSTLKQYNRHAITKLKHIIQAKSRKKSVKEYRTEIHVASASLSPCSGLPYSRSIST